MSSKKSATFNMRMEPQKKKQMEEFFQELGLTLAYGVNIFFEKCIMEGNLIPQNLIPALLVPAKQFIYAVSKIRAAHLTTLPLIRLGHAPADRAFIVLIAACDRQEPHVYLLSWIIVE